MGASKQADFVAPPAKEEWGGEELAGGAAPVTDWSADGAPAAAAAPAAAPAAPAFQVTDDWAAQTETSDWAAQSAPAGEAAAPAQTWVDPASGARLHFQHLVSPTRG